MNSKDNLPLVSVLMTVYNREKYIAEAITSVMASTYQNWELIVVDDGSKDRSVDIVKSFCEKDNRIVLYINEKNLGDYPNRNQAAAYAKGKYLKYVDADDMIYSYCLEQLVRSMEQFPKAGYGLCSLPQDKILKFPFELSPEETYKRHYFEQPVFHKSPLSAIINRAVFMKVGGFTGKPKLGDFEMWHILSQQHTVVLMPIGFVWYREHDEQESVANRTDPTVPYKYLLLADSLLKSRECPLNDGDRKKALAINNQHKIKTILSTAKHHSIKKSVELYNEGSVGLYSIVQVLLKMFWKKLF